MNCRRKKKEERLTLNLEKNSVGLYKTWTLLEATGMQGEYSPIHSNTLSFDISYLFSSLFFLSPYFQ